MNKKFFGKIALFVVAASLSVGGLLIYSTNTAAALIPQGITISGMDVSGLSVNEAQQLVDQKLASFDNTSFTFVSEAGFVVADAHDIGLHVKNADVAEKAVAYGTKGNILERFQAKKLLESGAGYDYALAYDVDVQMVQDFLEASSKKIELAEKDWDLVRKDNAFEIIEGANGVAVDFFASAEGFSDYIQKQWNCEDVTFALTTDTILPKGSREELEAVKDVLGSYVTDYSTSGANRKQNVTNGISKLNGKLLYPGEELSVYQTLQPFNEKNGYALAAGYENGSTVDTYGGGICQVSSTMYGAIRQAEVHVVTRAAHSMIVSYVEPSQDAAISGGKDLAIRNTREYPIFLEGYTDSKKVYFTIYGKEDRDPGHLATYETEITEETPYETEYRADESLKAGTMKTIQSGHTGYKARLWKTITENGVEVSRNVYNNSTYNVSNKIIAVGVADCDTNVKRALVQAIDNQNEEKIKEIIERYKNGEL